MSRYYPYICGPYTNILRANFVIRTLLPFISCAFFDICSASVTMCRQNFVTCGEFLVMMTGRNIMSSGYALLSKLYDDIPTMRHENRRTQACQGDLGMRYF